MPIQSRATPLPTLQVAVLMGVRLAEPIAYTVIFPFINEMVEFTRITDNPDRVGFYSGVVESVFAFVQVFTVYHWAKLSDRIGRKPVILLGLLGVVLSSSLFGLATSFFTMLLFRALAGALCGNVAVIKASLGDITDESNSTEAFALYGLTWTVGQVLGSALGGALVHPADRWPGLFTAGLWEKHPFLLPCLVSALCTLTGILFALVVYRESLPSLPGQSPLVGLKLLATGKSLGGGIRLSNFTPGHHRSASRASIESEDTLIGSPSTPTTPVSAGKAAAMKNANGSYADPADTADAPLLAAGRQWGFWDLMGYWPVRASCLALFLNSFVAGSWAAVSLLFWYDKNNGLGMSPSAIGGALAINGLWCIVCQLLILTRLRRALGLARSYQILTGGWLLVWVLLPRLRPLLELVESPGTDGKYAPQRGWVMTIAVNAFLAFVTLVALNNSLLMVVVNDSAPDRTALGAVNGISTAVGCLARVVGPSLVSALFAISMDAKVLGGRLWWIFMLVVSVLNLGASLLVTDSGDKPVALPLDTLDTVHESEEEGWTGAGRGSGAAGGRGGG